MSDENLIATKKLVEEQGMDKPEAPEGEEEGVLYLEEVPKEQNVKIKGKDGKIRSYIAREMDGDGLTAWMSVSTGRVKRNRAGQPVGKIDFSQFHASLISLCLYDAQTNEPVKKSVIEKWPATTQNKLFLLCRKMNGLDEESEENEKNA